jgi:hypothetical protein
MANSGLIIVGLVIIFGFFAYTQVLHSPQEKQMMELKNDACGIPIIGQIVQVANPNVAEECEEANFASQLFRLAPLGYILGIVIVLVGIATGGRKEVIKEVVKETVKTEPKKCAKCGSVISGNFCSSCGTKVE